MAIHITGSKLRQIIKEELRLFETKDKGPPEEISYEVEVPHRPHDHDTEIADAIQHAQMRAIDDHENRYDISDDHGDGYEALGKTKGGKARYKVYLTLIKR
jgi:hypothetical protein